MESDSLPFSVTLSDDITPPLSPVLVQDDEQQQKRIRLSQDFDIPWAPPRFECSRHRQSSSSWLPDNNGFLASRTLSRLLDGNVADQHEGLTTQLFGFSYVTTTALLDQMVHLFSTLRQVLGRIESLLGKQSHWSLTDPLIEGSKKLREQVLHFFFYIHSFIHRYLTTSKLVSIPVCHEVPSLYSQQVEGFPGRLAAELDSVSLFIGRLNELSSSRQYANSHDRQASHDHLLLHCHLDVRWYIIQILHHLQVSTEGSSHEMEVVDCLNKQVEKLMQDLLTIATIRHNQLSLNEVHQTSLFPCSCLREMWLLLVHLLDHRHMNNSATSFWGTLHHLLCPILEKTDEEQPGGVTAKDPQGLCWWLLQQLTSLYRYDKTGQEITQPITRSHWYLVEDILKKVLSKDAEVPEAKLLSYLRHLLVLCQLWEPHTKILTSLWDHFYRKLNHRLTVPGQGIQGLASISKSALGWFQMCKKRCDDHQSSGQETSFHLFLRILACKMKKWNAANNTQAWKQLQGRYVTRQPVTSGESAHGSRDMEMFPVTASTPFHGMQDAHLGSPTDGNSIESENGSSSSMSGVELMEESEQTIIDQGLDISVSYRHQATGEWLEKEESSDNDSDYEPDVTIHEGPLPEVVEAVGQEEVVIGELPPSQEEAPCEVRSRSGLHAKISAEDAVDVEFAIVSKSCLKGLCKEARQVCQQCGKVVTVKMTPSGTAVHVTWVCPDGHVSTWCGQETLQRSHVGDIRIASAIIMTGNNFKKIKLLAEFMKLGMISSSTFYAHQRKYVAPTIEKTWENVQQGVLERHKDSPVVVCGDGRNDSPGFCARYLTYILMAHETKDILDVQVVEKRETGGKSPLMELEGLKRGLTKLQDGGVEVGELVTDAHPSITRYMREKKPTIRHSWDVWHAGKNLGKKLTKAAGKVSTCALLYWVRHIVFHFWWCAETCGRRSQAFLAKWRGLTHHVTNKHEWVSGLGEGTVTCSHGELEEREEWLQAGSPPHRALVEICYEQRFLKNVERYVTFRHTSTIESLNNHILMYASKRYSFGYRAYRARNFMAMIDYQAHKDRPYKTDEQGNPKHYVRWSKHAGQYVTIGVKEPKTYPYVRDMMAEIFRMRSSDPLPLFSQVEMMENDPAHIRPRLATALPPPDVDEILARRRSRFSL